MKTAGRKLRSVLLFTLAALWMMCLTAAAEGASGDNSLYSLGLENGTCDPEFYYSTLEYTVTVPAGTEELYLSPVTSDANASIIDISGTVLENGSGTATITVEAANGAQVTYTLHVIPDVETPAETEETEKATASEEEKKAAEAQKQSESEEQARIQAEYKAIQDKVNTLTTENNDLKDRIDLLLKVMYGLIGLAVLLLFLIINQSLRNKDLKDDLKDAKIQADQNYDFARKDQNLQSDFYYAPMNGGMPGQMPQQGMNQSMPMAEATQNVQAAFGNASQILQSQPLPGQANAPVQPKMAPMQDSAPVRPEIQTPEREPKLSRKEMKKLEKEGRKAAEVQPQEPTVIQSTMEEPDVNVDMIDL